MHVRLIEFWEELKSSYWFVPGIMAVGAILLSLATIALDGYFRADVLRNLGFIWSGGAEGARGLLQTVAGSMITVAGVTFSITMVALSFASSQFGSRLLRNFMADTGNQLVLGTFIATYIYCLLVLRTVRSGDGNEFVPYLSVTTGLVLALVSLLVLIYFIHHMALSMQAPYVIGEVAADLLNSIEHLFPSEVGANPGENGDPQRPQDLPDEFEEQAQPVCSKKNGYIQAIDEDELMRVAHQDGLILKLPYRPGHFVVEGNVLAFVWPNNRLNGQVEAALRETFLIGKQRTLTQDVEFGFEQLVEVAERSLSSGINATFTALACIDWLGAALAKLSQIGFPSPYRYDRQGSLRIIFGRPLLLEGVIDAAFNQIRQSARGNIAVRIQLLEKIAILYGMTSVAEAKQALERHARLIESDSGNHLPAKDDQKEIQQRYQHIQKLVSGQTDSRSPEGR